MPICAICKAEAPRDANLCSVCADTLGRPAGFCAEQLLSTALRPTEAALVDSWGRVHPLEDFTPIGRRPAARGIAILEASVSRNHAELSRQIDGTWIVLDAGSSNGTYVNGEKVTKQTVLESTSRLTFGEVGLYFLKDASALKNNQVTASTATVRPNDKVPFGEDMLDEPAEPEETTFAGFPKLPIQFFQPSAGGGGLIDVAGARLQLTTAQYDLMRLLVTKMQTDQGLPIEVRGFTPSLVLISSISWDTPYPVENHLKQLIRRVRKLLDGEELGNLIESRRGFGYRLRCIPIDAPSS